MMTMKQAMVAAAKLADTLSRTFRSADGKWLDGWRSDGCGLEATMADGTTLRVLVSGGADGWDTTAHMSRDGWEEAFALSVALDCGGRIAEVAESLAGAKSMEDAEMEARARRAMAAAPPTEETWLRGSGIGWPRIEAR